MTEGRTYYADCCFMWTNDYAKCGKWNVCPSCGKYQTLKYPELYQTGCPYNCPDFEKAETQQAPKNLPLREIYKGQRPPKK